MRILNNFIIAITSILDRVFFSLFIMIQLTVSLYLVYENISINKALNADINAIESLFDTDNIYALNNTDELDTLFGLKFKEDNILQRQETFDSFLSNSNDFTRLISNNDPLMVERFNQSSKFLASDTAQATIQDNNFNKLRALNGDFNFFNNYKFPIEDGRYFNTDDFITKDVVPVILGNDYKDIFKLNDELLIFDEINETTKKVKVIGFLKKNLKMYESTFSPDSVYLLDNYILTPFYQITPLNKDNEHYDSLMRNMYFAKYLNTMLISDKSSDELSKLISTKSNELNLYNSDIKSGSSMVQAYRDMFKTQKQFLLIIFYVVIIFTSLNVITTLLEFINKNRKSFAVNIMCGGTFTDLLQRIFFQVSTLMLASFTLFTVIKHFTSKGMDFAGLDINILATTALIGLGISVILTIIPAISIAKLPLNKVLKGE